MVQGRALHNWILVVGTRLGQYVIEEPLGAGGMGVVYRAFDTRLERQVAIKLIDGADERSGVRLLREARSASALNHPHVCTIYEVGELERTTYLVMEYVEGQTLAALIAAGGLPMETVLTYGAQVARALAHAHERGVVHRDLKSANVVVSHGHAKVLDFGLAVRQAALDLAADDTRANDTLLGPGVVAGTLAYMSPETLRGAASDARADIWALGVLLYEMACRRLPFEGQTPYEVSNRILNEAPPPLGHAVPQALGAIIGRCLSKTPSRRYQNASEVAAALDALGSGILEPRLSAGALAVQTRAVLVLPFLNVGSDPESDYFSDGLTDELITDLSSVNQLRVISRTSSMQLKGTTRSLAEIARELRVDQILEGTVRRSGQQLRITAKLVDPTTDSPIWADKYSGTLDDVFRFQETISRSIVDALKIRLSVEEERRLAERPIADVRAYEWYLRARQELLKFTEDSLTRALECLDRASAIVGENVLLLAATGTTYWQYVNGGINPDPANLDRAETCARRIKQIDPGSPHGYRVAGLVCIHRGDIVGAVRELKQALQRDPNDTDSLMWGSLLGGLIGKVQLAEAWAARLVEIDPVTPFFQALPGAAIWMRGDFETACAEFRAHEAAVREAPILRLVFATMLVAAGRSDEGHAVLDELAQALPDNPFGQLATVYRHAFKADRAAVETALTPELVAALEGDPQYCWFLAQCYALVGDIDGGLRWVQAASERGFINYPMLADLDPFLASLRADPRYAALMAGIEQRWRALDV